MTKRSTQTRRVRQRRCWCGTGECWAVECDTCCEGVERLSTCSAIIQAMSNCPGYFPRLLLWVVLPQSMDGRSLSPSQLCWEHGVTGQEETPSAALWKGAGLHPPCLGTGAGAIRTNILSTEGKSHRVLLQHMKPKKIRLTVLQTASGTFCLSVLPSRKGILR